MKQRDFTSLSVRAGKIDACVGEVRPHTPLSMNQLLHYISSNPVKYTYFAIGSCPHSWGADLTLSRDQLLPAFLRTWMTEHPRETFRCIHFDPAFSKYEEEIQAYFSELDFYRVESATTSVWRSNSYSIEILLCAEMFHHPSPVYPGNDEWVLETLVDSILQGEEPLDQKLVVQEFTGHDLDSLFKSLYTASPFKKRFLKNILFDITYGMDSGCCTNLEKHAPFQSPSGDFYNLLLLGPHHLHSLIGIDTKMDTAIKYHLIREFKQLLNQYHVDYRRRLRGETVLFHSGGYGDSTPPSDIMAGLLTKLRVILKVLYDVKHITQENYSKCTELFYTYKDHDVYKWYTTVNNTVPILDFA